MKGQWMGDYQGSVSGRILINIDKVGNHFECEAYLNPSEKYMPSTVAYLETKSCLDNHEATAKLFPVDPRSGFQSRWEEVKNFFPDVLGHSEKAEVSLKFSGQKLLIDATTDLGVNFCAELERPVDQNSSRIIGKKISWEEFKAYVSGISKTKYLFRGQEQAWRLRTSFHRKGRSIISEFVNKDVKQLHKRLSAITSHYFDLSVPEQNGSFFNLLQHHGYPTPLLDWSYSPYVSAFFAFRGLPQDHEGGGCIRIFVFDQESWQKNYDQIQFLNPAFPHVSVTDFIALDNPRLVPQQAITTVSNVDDIEVYMQEKSMKDEVEYLLAFDIPANEREKVMSDLKFMGITAGSMFPGVDGVCEELRELNF